MFASLIDKICLSICRTALSHPIAMQNYGIHLALLQRVAAWYQQTSGVPARANEPTMEVLVACG
jgi:hypothetical protein